MEYGSEFNALIAGPLQRALHQRLRRVIYYVLSSDRAGFDAAHPNASGGCQAVGLGFDTFHVVLEWAWEPVLRDAGTHYHIQARVSADPASERSPSEKLDASATLPWERFISHPVIAFWVLGIGYSPQAIRVGFASGSVTVSIGHTGAGLPGDADELLVFESEPETIENWRVLWSTTGSGSSRRE